MMTTENVNEAGAKIFEGLLEEDIKSVDMSVPLQTLFDDFMTYISKFEFKKGLEILVQKTLQAPLRGACFYFAGLYRLHICAYCGILF